MLACSYRKGDAVQEEIMGTKVSIYQRKSYLGDQKQRPIQVVSMDLCRVSSQFELYPTGNGMLPQILKTEVI